MNLIRKINNLQKIVQVNSYRHWCTSTKHFWKRRPILLIICLIFPGTFALISSMVRAKWRHISMGFGGMDPPEHFWNLVLGNGISCILRKFWAKSKGLKSHLALHILTEIYLFIKIKAAVGKQAISIQTIASNAIVKMFWRTQKLYC